MPQRVYDVETTRSTKGYRLVPSLDPNISAIEISLKRNGFTYYMPADIRVIRDRKKTNVWTKRRFALLLGYVFVEDSLKPIDWKKLEEKTPGIEKVVRSAGVPIPILKSEMQLLREMEAQSAEIAEEKLRFFQERAALKSQTRRMTSSKFPVGSKVVITKGIAQMKTGEVIGSDREGRLKLLVQKLEMSVPFDAVEHDYTEAAE
jgi:transcription antitermination factor NusG